MGSQAEKRQPVVSDAELAAAESELKERQHALSAVPKPLAEIADHMAAERERLLGGGHDLLRGTGIGANLVLDAAEDLYNRQRDAMDEAAATVLSADSLELTARLAQLLELRLNIAGAAARATLEPGHKARQSIESAEIAIGGAAKWVRRAVAKEKA